MSKSGAAARVQAALKAASETLTVEHFPETTRTAAEAASAIGCAVEAIAKSLIFKAAKSGRPVLVVASGANRVDEAQVAEALGEPLERATPAFVREKTGFAIGGVPPVAHLVPPETFLDEDLFALPEIWAAAGTPNAVFRLTPQSLRSLTGGRVLRLRAA